MFNNLFTIAQSPLPSSFLPLPCIVYLSPFSRLIMDETSIIFSLPVLLLLALLLPLTNSLDTVKCGSGAPCVWLDKELGWGGYDPSLETAQGRPHPIRTGSWNESDTTLFLTMSSFRDKLCPVTLVLMGRFDHDNTLIVYSIFNIFSFF